MSKNLQIPANGATLIAVLVKTHQFNALHVPISNFYTKTLAFINVLLAFILISLTRYVYNAPITAKCVILLIQFNLV